jgi:hypothetical protein
MQRSAQLPQPTLRTRHVRIKRQLVNSLVLLLVIVSALLLLHWEFPYLFSVLAWVWAADAFLLVVLAGLWALGSWAFASGKIVCPACSAPFATGFHLWIPKTCHACGFDVTAPRVDPTSNQRSERP